MKQKTLFSSILLLVCCLAISIDVLAQADINSAINTATNQLKSVFNGASKLCMAAGGIVGLIGGIKVYAKFTKGDPDTFSAVASWGGGAIFLLLTSVVLKLIV